MSTTKLSWRESKTKHGLKPSRTILCSICGAEMFLRASTVRPLAHNPSAYVDDMTWKCKGCSLAIQFGVPMDPDYAKATIKLRGEPVWIPMEDWKKDKILKKRLETLGYV